MAVDPTTQRTVVLQDDALRRIEGFTQIPNVVLKHPAISYGAKVAFGVLLSYAWQEDFCYPAQDRLARDLNCSVRQVQRLLKELKDGAFIDWKQQGLNRPNVYYILPMARWSRGLDAAKHKDTTNLSRPETTVPSTPPEATNLSLQETTNASHKEDTTKKIQNNVNVIPNRVGSNGRHRSVPAISERGLKSRYGLSDSQVDETRRLVQFQIDVLGAAERNHAAYVERAAEAVRDNTSHILMAAISDVKDASHRKAIGSLPGYFTRVYDAMREEHLRTARVAPAVSSDPPTQAGSEERQGERERLLAAITAKGRAVPDHLRHAPLAALAAWNSQIERAAAQQP